MDPHESYVQWKLHGIMGIGQPERLLPEALRCPPIGGQLDRVRSTTSRWRWRQMTTRRASWRRPVASGPQYTVTT